MKRKFIHINKRTDEDWSFGAFITRDKSLDEFYLLINFYKWSISIGKLAYLKSFDLDES